MLKTKIYRNRLKIISFFAFLTVLNNEYLTYTIQRFLLWPSISCEESHECVRVLFVADPQIIGEQFEMPFPVGNLARWDCDRYLQNTFTRAVAHVKPDAVIFLGDLMDEGSVATKEEYDRYLKRFFSIFHTTKDIQAIYNPGDNDIGGEDDMITEPKLQRYKYSFSQPSQISLKSITVHKVNRLLYSMPESKPNSRADSSKLSIVVTHMPLLHAPNHFVRKVIRELQPKIIFSAHEHKSLHTIVHTSNLNGNSIMEALLPSNSSVWKFYFDEDVIHEIMVPTCSYRMGVLDVGYGAAVFDLTDNTVLYTVLWLPYRLYQILFYVLLLCLIMLIFSLTIVNKVCRRIKTRLKACRMALIP